MKKILILLLTFSVSAHAVLGSIVKSGSKALKKDVEPPSATMKKEIDGDSDVKNTDELSKTDNKTFEEAFYGSDDLDLSLNIEDYLGIGAVKSGKSKASGKKSSSSSGKSKKTKFSKEDFRKSSFNFRNKQNIDKAPSARMFFSWLSLRLGTETHKALSDELIEDLNSEIERFYKEDTSQKTDDDPREAIYSSSLSIHKEVMRQMEKINDPIKYAPSLIGYYDYLNSWGWSGFNPTQIYVHEKMKGFYPGSILAEEAGFLSFYSKDTLLDERKKLHDNVKSLYEKGGFRGDLNLFLFCEHIRSTQPGASHTFDDKLKESFCMGRDLLNRAEKIDWPSEPAHVFKAVIKSNVVYEMSFEGVSDEYTSLRNQVMLQVPMFIDEVAKDSDNAEWLSTVLLSLGLAELNIGNLENAFEIGRLALEYSVDFPELKAEIFGLLFAGIFLEAKDTVMLKRYITVMELAGRATSEMYTPVNNVLMAASLHQHYKRLVGEQKL